MTERTMRRVLFGGCLLAPTVAVSVTTLGPWVTGLLALVVFCTAAAVWRMTVAAIYGDVARMDAAAAKAAAANRAFYDPKGNHAMTYRPSDEDRKALAFTDRLGLPALVERIVAREVAAEHLKRFNAEGALECQKRMAEVTYADRDELRAKVAIVERERDEAREDGYWQGFREGRDEAETRDLSFDELTDRAETAEAKVAAVEALADEWEGEARAHREAAMRDGDVERDWIAGRHEHVVARLRAALREARP